MLLKILSQQDKSDFLAIAELLTLCDKPILWDGKKIEEITPQANFENATIQKSEKEITLMDELEKESGTETSKYKYERSGFFSIRTGETVEGKLLEKIKNYPFKQIEEPTTRLGAALAVLKDLLKGKKTELPATPKLMLFELMQVALVDGNISSIKMQLLNEFTQHYRLADYVFYELLERAEVTSREINKTITIIFE